MRNVLGNNLTLSVFGESHQETIGVVIDGITPGIKIDYDEINKFLNKRKPNTNYETKRLEKDEIHIVSGLFNDYTTGAPLTILINNENVISKDYSSLKDLPRPGHSDYAAYLKYHGFNDYRGGGHFSGRITAPIVASGAIFSKMLEKFNIHVGVHIKQCGKVIDSSFSNDIENEIIKINQKKIPCIDSLEEDIEKEILYYKDKNDSIGGIIQCAITSLPAGLGEPMFSSLEGELAKALFGIGGIKGIEFGLGFDFKDQPGSKANDPFRNIDGKIVTTSNNNGGINGGISNGMPVIFNLAIKPTPSISLKQETISLKDNSNQELVINGRHDPAIIRRICIVVQSIVNFVICDLLITRYGTDVFLKDHL